VLWSSLVDKTTGGGDVAGVDPGDRHWGVFDFERPTAGCRFAPRCPVYEAKGRPPFCTNPATAPTLRKVDDTHHVRCHYPLQ